MAQENLPRVGSKIHALEFEISARICPCTYQSVVQYLANISE
jgi:hypothetical protein